MNTYRNIAFFSDFQYGFRYSWSTADLLTSVFDKITRAFNKSGATRAVALDISKAFERVCYAGLLHKLKSYGISGKIFDLILSFLSNRQFWVILDRKSSQKYPVNAGSPQDSILGPTLFLILMTFLIILSVILLSKLMIPLSTLSVIRHLIWSNNYNWLLNLNLIDETLWTGAGSGLLTSKLDKLNWFHLTSLITLVLLIFKKRCWDWLSVLNWIGLLLYRYC